MENISMINNVMSWDYRLSMAEERKNNLNGLPIEESEMAEDSQKFEKRSSRKQIIYRRNLKPASQCC
jgi:hypothetical protein